MYSLLNKLHLFVLTKYKFILTQIVHLHVHYMFRPVRKPSSGMSIQNSYKGRCLKAS